METPSVKTLSAIFDNPKEAKRILSCTNTRTIKSDAVDRLRQQCLNPPSKYCIRFYALNELGDFHGMEYAETVDGEAAVYLNAGDRYIHTLIYWRGNYRVQSLGDFIETMERNGVSFK